MRTDPIEKPLNSLMEAIEALGGKPDKGYGAERLQDALMDYLRRSGLDTMPDYLTGKTYWGNINEMDKPNRSRESI